MVMRHVWDRVPGNKGNRAGKMSQMTEARKQFFFEKKNQKTFAPRDFTDLVCTFE